MKARFDKKLFVGIALAAALTAPAAAAEAPASVTVPNELSYIQAPGGNSDVTRFQNFRGGPGGAGPILPSDYLGHELGGPGGVTDVGIRYPAPASAPTANSFDWADAAVGAGFASGLALLALGCALARRRRRSLAHA